MAYPVMTYIPAQETLEISEKEAVRYLGYGRSVLSETDKALIGKGMETIKKTMAGKACYSRFPVCFRDTSRIVMPYGEISSSHLYRQLAGCSEIYIFAATIGAETDRIIRRLRHTSMAEAAVLQACGAAAIEAVCDALNTKLETEAAAEGKKLRRRFSPGYGDLSLENQKGIFEVLNPPKYIGLTLMDTLIMSPEKSVTAVIGVEDGQNSIA
ncbi:MAG: Vitamin B12 dependent methionine synthase activation subunit [Lachnospiraceae bacterium]|nr:Vitamin B12 dependent methionine synthase activation subunit [Lachnospiraceae bacterium]